MIKTAPENLLSITRLLNRAVLCRQPRVDSRDETLLQSEVIRTFSVASHSHCPACGRPAALWRFAVQSYALRSCPECKVEFLDPQPDDTVLAAIYNDRYFLGEQSDAAAERRSRMKSATG